MKLRVEESTGHEMANAMGWKPLVWFGPICSLVRVFGSGRFERSGREPDTSTACLHRRCTGTLVIEDWGSPRIDVLILCLDQHVSATRQPLRPGTSAPLRKDPICAISRLLPRGLGA